MSSLPQGRNRRSRRHGATMFFVVGALVLIAVVVVLGLIFARGGGEDVTKMPLLKAVERGPYEHIVLEQGEVESSDNVEIRCEVRSRQGGTGPSTSIIDVIPEGEVVEEGDWLVTFDSSGLEQEHSRQRIVVNTSEAAMIQAKAVYDTALIAKDEYINGAYNEQKKAIENEIYVAEENLKKAQLSYESTKRLVARGSLTTLQLEGDNFRVNAAQNELDLAKKKLEVLEKFTKRKMLTQLESDIQAAKVKWDNERDNHKTEMANLQEIADQLEKCKVFAPQAGQVVYANVQSSRSGSEFVVEPGVAVRERQVIIRLPDPQQMQVRAKISESRINLVRDGMPVSIRIDAFGDKTVKGVVTKVNKYAEPGNWWSSSAKEYVTLIRIIDPPPEIRVGLTAEVRIHVEYRDDALQIPVQAVYERGGNTFCLVKADKDWETREIVVSSTNDKTVAIDEERSDPLKASEMVVMNPRKHLDKFDTSRFPSSEEGPPETTSPIAAAEAGDATGEETAAATGGSPKGGAAAGGGPGGGGPGGGGGAAGMISSMDTDGDGKLSTDELPERLRERMTQADTNGDGGIDAAELGAAFARMRAAGGGRPGGGPPGGGPPGDGGSGAGRRPGGAPGGRPGGGS